MAFKFDEELTKRVITKRAQSEPLTTDEENYARKLFDHMMSSKKSVQKTVRIITGADLRKQHTDDLSKMATAPTRTENHPRQVGLKPEGDKPNAQPDTSATAGEKLPDVDEKPKQLTTENQRMADITQHGIDRVENEHQEVVSSVAPSADTKFVSADPVKIGDVVVKNFAKTGQIIYRGVVTNLDSENRATVKWANGMQTFEWGHLLVKARAVAEQIAKGAISHTEAYERVKDKPGVEDPHALAQHIVEEAGGEEKTKKVAKNGDIAPEPESAMTAPAPAHSTPFQELVYSLESLIGVAGQMKQAQARIDDPEVVEYYDQLIEHLREMAETILSALSMELSEAQEE